MKLRDIVIAVIILGVIGFILYNISTTDNTPELDVTPTPSAVERDIEERFGRTIPEDVERAELIMPSGVSRDQISAIATRDVRDKVTIVTVLADLDDPQPGTRYFAWVSNDEEFVLLGALRVAKGGWLIDYETDRNLTNYDRVVISQESQVSEQPKGVIVEGTFE